MLSRCVDSRKIQLMKGRKREGEREKDEIHRVSLLYLHVFKRITFQDVWRSDSLPLFRFSFAFYRTRIRMASSIHYGTSMR